MTTRNLFLLFFISLPLMVVGQVSNEDLKTMMILRDLERESRPSRSGYLGPDVEGSPYLTEHFNAGSLTLYKENKTYELEAMRYDIHHFGLEVRINQQISFLDGLVVKEFEYADSTTSHPSKFVNGKDYTMEGVPLRGFLEILCWGKIDVYAYDEASLLRPNYNRAIGSGNENYVIAKKRKLLYSPGTELRPLKKKELTKLWNEKAAEMEKFRKINRLSLSRDRDLMLMIDYFNTL